MGRQPRNHEFVCGGRQYQITHEANELRQYPEHDAALLAKYS
jgi:hypothetical protein